MTPKDKQLLLIDLCGRLPYGVKCQIDIEKMKKYISSHTDEAIKYIKKLGIEI